MSHESTKDTEKKSPVNLVICWHMHQPQYQDQRTRHVHLPWTYLHAIKDYVDMAAVLERVPAARVVVNFTPVLLDQIEDYVHQFDAYFQHAEAFSDSLLAALSAPGIKSGQHDPLAIVRQCIRANENRLINRFPPFLELVQKARHVIEEPFQVFALEDRYFFDLLVWYHLAWMSETVRAEHPIIQRLVQKARDFTQEDRYALLGVMGESIRSIVPRYRVLAERGQVELCVSPDKHPILPLLLDFNVAREAMPHAPLPQCPAYPGGKIRAQEHLQRGIAIFERHFGFRPSGCWPSEGALSEDALRLLQETGFKWTASGGGVMGNSRKASGTQTVCIHRPYQFDHVPITCFFRDDHLSDLIGFNYSNWNEQDAVNNLIHHVGNIRSACEFSEETIVPIILDGENCWEYYYANGIPFLELLYQKLAQHPDIKLTTFSEYLCMQRHPVLLKNMVAGSWVYGTLSTWIGDAATNRAWDMLCQVKKDFDRVMASGRLSAEAADRAREQLAICEGSDWFWWFGDYNPAETVADFDRLYRAHLKNLYLFLEETPPEFLDAIISQGSGAPENDGVMRRGRE